MTLPVALIGAKALYLLYAWLIGAFVASWLSNRKGYGERPGLATGLLLSALAIIVWLLVPAKADSRWKLQGPVRAAQGGETVGGGSRAGVGEDSPDQ